MSLSCVAQGQSSSELYPSKPRLGGASVADGLAGFEGDRDVDDVSCTAADFKTWPSRDAGMIVGSFLASESFRSVLIEAFLNFMARGSASFRRRFLVDQVATSSSLVVCVSAVSCEARFCCLRKTSSCSAFSFLTASSLCLSACRTPSRKSTSSLSRDRN